MLSGLSVIDGIDRLLRGRPISITAAPSFVLAGTSLWAGFGFRPSALQKKGGEQWIRALVELAFLEAGFFFMLFVRAIARGETRPLAPLIGVVVSSCLAVAALKRWTLGAYGLVCVALIEFLGVAHTGAAEWATARFGMLVVYCFGAYYLRTAKGRRPSRRLQMLEKLSGRTSR